MVARRKGTKIPRDYDQRTRRELVTRAAQLGIEGRSRMGKGDLVRALRHRES